MDRIRLPPFRKEWHTGSSIMDTHSCHLLEKGGTRRDSLSRARSRRRGFRCIFSLLSSLALPVSRLLLLCARSLARSLACVCFCLLRTHPLQLCIMASVQGVFLNVAAISSSSACIAPVAQQSVSRRCLCLDFFFFFWSSRGFSFFFFFFFILGMDGGSFFFSAF